MNRSFGLGASAPTGLATARRDAFDPESSSRTGAERKRVRVEEARSFNDQRFIGAGGAGGVAAAAVATAAAHRLVWKPISCVIERSPEQCRMSLGMTVEVIRSTAVATARIEKCLGQPAAVPNIPRSVVDFGRVCLVVKVVPGGIGGSHDIRGGDIITSVNGQYVHAIEDIVASTRDASLLQIRGWRVFRSPPPATTQQQSQTYPANLYKAPVQSVDTQVTQLPRKPSTAGDWRSTATVSASSAPAPPECATSASMSSSVRSSSSPIRKRSKKKTVKTKPALAPEEAAAIANYAAYHGVSIDSVSLKQVKRSQGGLDAWLSVNVPHSANISGAPPARDNVGASATPNNAMTGNYSVEPLAPQPTRLEKQKFQVTPASQTAAFVQFVTGGTFFAGTSDGQNEALTQAHVARDIVHAALDSIDMKFDPTSGLCMVTSVGPAAAMFGVSRNDILIGAEWENREQPSRGRAFAEKPSFSRSRVTHLSMQDAFFRCPQGTLVESLLSCRPIVQFPRQPSTSGGDASGAFSCGVPKFLLRLTFLKVLFQPVITMFDDVGEYDGRIVAVLPPVKFNGSVADTLGLGSPWSVSVAYSDGDDLPLSLASAVEAMV
eukprot:INCI4185.2.p1 GENE.INCI4185.2~~INCI4185.2.p1  ORF type:complete len:606 (-),score=87.18 INCI4185.2:814-2631(-)